MTSAAAAFGMKLVKDEAILRNIEKFFKKFGRQMSVSNEKQAYVLEGSDVLANLVGTAPGIAVNYSGTRFFFLPGVPRELYQIFNDSVEPWFAGEARGAYCEKVLRCFGSPEATIDTALRDVDLSSVRLSYRVKFPEVLVRLTARAETISEAETTVMEAGRFSAGSLRRCCLR